MLGVRCRYSYSVNLCRRRPNNVQPFVSIAQSTDTTLRPRWSFQFNSSPLTNPDGWFICLWTLRARAKTFKVEKNGNSKTFFSNEVFSFDKLGMRGERRKRKKNRFYQKTIKSLMELIAKKLKKKKTKEEKKNKNHEK